jgi:DNA sulfur modification protein DndB
MHIRPAFKSAWVIDGQHRLFAYSGHKKAKSAHVAVLAFEGLPPSTQARLFVDINAKQKSVKPSLLQELFAELHWDAAAPATRVQAIVSKAVRVLDEEKDSALYGRVQTADATKDVRRCVSLASLFKALEKSDFYIRKEVKGEVIEYGPLWAGENEATLARTVTLVKAWLGKVRDGAPEWWDLGSAEGGGFAMNDSITACINALRSVLLFLESKGRNLIRLTDAELVDAVTAPYGEAVANYFANLTLDDRKRYRDLRGSQGQTTRTRRLQQAIRQKVPAFDPPGLDEFINSEKEQTNLKAKVIIDRLEGLLKKVIVEELKGEFTTDQNAWWQEGVPQKIRLEVMQRFESDNGGRGSREAYFDLVDYKTIATNNWSLFQKLIGFGKGNDSKEKQTKWLQEVNEWRKQVAHASSGVVLSVDSLAQLEGYYERFKEKVSSLGDGLEDGDDQPVDAETSE